VGGEKYKAPQKREGEKYEAKGIWNGFRVQSPENYRKEINYKPKEMWEGKTTKSSKNGKWKNTKPTKYGKGLGYKAQESIERK